MPKIETKMSNQNNDIKTEQLLLYVTEKLKNCPNYGSILLNKVLYYIDNVHYLKYGKPISSFSYVRQNNGPTPAPSMFMPMRERMIKEKVLEQVEIEHFGRIQKRLIPKKKHKEEIFSSHEIEFIDDIVLRCSQHNATEISDISHTELAWKFASNMETMPLFTFLLTEAELTDEDISWATDKIEKYAMSNN